MTYECLLYEVKDGIATLTLNRPDRLNALGGSLRDDLHDAVTRSAADPQVRVMVITGAGKGFCSGGDVKAMCKTNHSILKIDFPGIVCGQTLNSGCAAPCERAEVPKEIALDGHVSAAGENSIHENDQITDGHRTYQVDRAGVRVPHDVVRVGGVIVGNCADVPIGWVAPLTVRSANPARRQNAGRETH